MYATQGRKVLIGGGGHTVCRAREQVNIPVYIRLVSTSRNININVGTLHALVPPRYMYLLKVPTLGTYIHLGRQSAVQAATTALAKAQQTVAEAKKGEREARKDAQWVYT